MKSFSNIREYRILYRAAVFIMAFALMFTTVMPELAAGGTAYAASSAAGVNGMNKSYKYRVLIVVAEYNGSYNGWPRARSKWRDAAINRIKKVDPNVTNADIDINLRHTIEFNCLNDDFIGTYDYILFIANVPFTHVGDRAGETVYFSNPSMMIDGLGNTTVTAGNDITNAAAKKIKLFYDCGYPVEYMGYDGKSFKARMGSPVEGDVNETNIAKLYYQTNGDSHVLYTNGETSKDNDERLKNLKNNRITLEVTKKPKKYTEGFDNSTEDTSKILDYTFEIKDNMAGADAKKYTAYFYIDMNSDGRFDTDTEAASDMSITLYSNRKVTVQPNALKVNTKYKLTVNASDYTGFVNWKLFISDNSDPGKRFTFASDACKLQLMKGQSKEKLRVVQLIASPAPSQYSSKDTWNSVYLPTKKEVEWIENNIDWTQGDDASRKEDFCKKVKNCTEKGIFDVDETNPGLKIWDSKVDGNKTNVNERLNTLYYFYEALYKGTKDESGAFNSDMALLYDIDIRRIYVNSLPSVVKKDDYRSIYQYLTNNFDMIIVGFADHYDDISDNVSSAIEAFATEGKSVLFTHDTSSYVNTYQTDSDTNNWGYHINKKFRNLLGMDRFGVTLKTSGKYLTNEALRAAGKDYINNTSGRYIHGYTDITIIDRITDVIKSNKNDTNYVPNYIQNVGGKNNNFRTENVALINMGAVTEYPYVTSQLESSKGDSFEFKIKPTHAQYYQLDLEADDIVVWYALNGGTSNEYSNRYNDGRNNYYIYSKGNIIYCGAGHSPGLNDSEVRLFVNTMMAAHRASKLPVSIEMTDWDASTTKTTANNRTYDYVTLPVDYIKKATGGAYGESIINNKSNGRTQQYRRVKFKIYDRLGTANKTAKNLSVNFYKSASAADTSSAQKLNYYANAIFRMSDGKVVMKDGKAVNGQTLQSGTEYYIYVPLSEFNSKQIFRGEVSATVDLTDSSEDAASSKRTFDISNSIYVNFNNRLQFNLG